MFVLSTSAGEESKLSERQAKSNLWEKVTVAPVQQRREIDGEMKRWRG